MNRIANPIATDKLCSYGCGNIAKFINGSNNLMCQKSHTSCPKIKKMNAEAKRPTQNNRKEIYKNLPQESKDRMAWNKGKFTKTIFAYGCGGNHKSVLIEERSHKCENCGLSNWLGKPITLELEHVDGDNQNNVKNNLKLLCPNCHSFTPTWKGKNSLNKKHRKYVSDKEFIDALNSSKNIRQALLKLKLTPKGANYIRAYDFLNKKGDVVKLVDTPGLSPDVSAWEFESPHPHQ